jgi:hypothetical protein
VLQHFWRQDAGDCKSTPPAAVGEPWGRTLAGLWKDRGGWQLDSSDSLIGGGATRGAV